MPTTEIQTTRARRWFSHPSGERCLPLPGFVFHQKEAFVSLTSLAIAAAVTFLLAAAYQTIAALLYSHSEKYQLERRMSRFVRLNAEQRGGSHV
jgi:predicted outer membrane lipoprotein